MITAKQILERYLTYVKSEWAGHQEVFINPDWSEIQRLDRIRFSAFHDKKEIYVWFADLPHYEVRKKEITPYYFPEKTHGTRLDGAAEKEGNVFKMSYESGQLIDNLRQGPEPWLFVDAWTEILENDWSWTRKYHIDLEGYLVVRRRQMIQIKKEPWEKDRSDADVYYHHLIHFMHQNR